MPSIVDFPTEPKFTIKAVASQTGIRPVTLRAWERRHEFLYPYRADNHYRLYSERDIAILRWLKYRVDEGVSIGSAISELRSMTSNSNWPEAIPMAPSPIPGKTSIAPAQYARMLSSALIKHDENRASSLLREVHASLNLLSVCAEVLNPAIQQVDESWYRGEIDMSEARFAQSYLRCKLLSLLQAYTSRHNAPLILVGCAPMEVHELQSLMLAVLLRSEGYRVEYLGPDINIEDLADYASYELPAMVILWANSEFTAREMRRMQSLLQGIRSKPFFAYSGSAFDKDANLPEIIQGAYLGRTMEINLGRIKNLLKTRQKAPVRSE